MQALQPSLSRHLYLLSDVEIVHPEAMLLGRVMCTGTCSCSYNVLYVVMVRINHRYQLVDVVKSMLLLLLL